MVVSEIDCVEKRYECKQLKKKKKSIDQNTTNWYYQEICKTKHESI